MALKRPGRTLSSLDFSALGGLSRCFSGLQPFLSFQNSGPILGNLSSPTSTPAPGQVYLPIYQSHSIPIVFLFPGSTLLSQGCPAPGADPFIFFSMDRRGILFCLPDISGCIPNPTVATSSQLLNLGTRGVGHIGPARALCPSVPLPGPSPGM